MLSAQCVEDSIYFDGNIFVELNWKVLNLSVSLLITTSEPQNTRLDLIFCYLWVPLLYKWMLHLNFELIVLLQIIIQIINLIILFIAFCGVVYPLIHTHSGLSLRDRGWGFALATKNAAPGYFHSKMEEKWNQKKSLVGLIPRLLVVFTWQLEILVTVLPLFFPALLPFTFCTEIFTCNQCFVCVVISEKILLLVYMYM